MFRSGSEEVTGEARTIDPNINDGDNGGGGEGSGSGQVSPTNIIIIGAFSVLAICAVMVALILRKRFEVAARSRSRRDNNNDDRIRASPSTDSSIPSVVTAPSVVEQPSTVPSKVKSVSFADSQPILSLTSLTNKIWGCTEDETEYEGHPYNIEDPSLQEVERYADCDGLEIDDDEYQTAIMIAKMEKIRAMQRYNEQLRQQISSNGSVISQATSRGSQRRRHQEELVRTVEVDGHDARRGVGRR